MAFDNTLAERVRKLLRRQNGVHEKKMFGGLAFMVNGHMCCGIVGNELMVRVGPEQHAEALAQPHARPMDFTGRPMKGMVYVEAKGAAKDTALRAWVERGLRFVRALPPKKLSVNSNQFICTTSRRNDEKPDHHTRARYLARPARERDGSAACMAECGRHMAGACEWKDE